MTHCPAAPCDDRRVLAATHLVGGALVGLCIAKPGARTAVALASHAALDSIDHDDSIGLAAQGAMATAVLGALAFSWGPRSRVVAGALAGSVPDAEIAISKLRGREGPYFFPTHWQLPHRPGQHPWQLPGRRVALGWEVATTAAVCAGLCALGRWRRSAHRA